MNGITVQTLVFALKRETQPLYGALTGPDGARAELMPVTRFSAVVPRGGCFSSDSYFNALFESHWLRWAEIWSWQLRIELAGKGRVQLVRAGAGRQPEIRDEASFAGESCRLTLHVSLPETNARGTRLYFKVHATGSEVVLQSAEWCATADEIRRVALVAGFCAFNREAYVIASAKRLLSDDRVWRVVQRLIIVDQGTAQSLAREIAQVPGAQGRIKVIGQRNFGGSGGFTRIMLETLDDPDATHVLLMDDDVEIEPESILRTAALFSIASRKITIGGQMLDLSRPTIMHESGAVLSRKQWLVCTRDRGRDVTSKEALSHFASDLDVDYNAWFYFAVSLDIIREIGLPLPFFINFDDVEYGLRLSEVGACPVSLPGIAVWHDPGYLKDGRWKAYYYQRNILIINAFHQLGSRSHAVRVFLRRWLRSLSGCQIVRPQLACDAVRDYLRGPEAIPEDPSIRSREIIQFCAIAPRKYSNPVGLFRMAARVFTSALHLWLNACQANAEWRQAANCLTSVECWKSYLGLTDDLGISTGQGEDQHAANTDPVKRSRSRG